MPLHPAAIFEKHPAEKPGVVQSVQRSISSENRGFGNILADTFDMASIAGSGNGESVQFGRRPHSRASALNYDVGAAIVALQNQTPRNDGAAIVALRNQTRTTVVIDVQQNATPGDYVSLLQHLTGQISEVQKDYNNRGDDIVKISAIFVAFQGALIGSLSSSAGRIMESIQCHDFWNTLILLALFLSTLAYLATIVLVLYYFLEQLKLLKLERQHQQERHSVVDNCLENARFTGSWRFLFSSYRRAFAVYGNPTDSCWWLLRVFPASRLPLSALSKSI